MSRFVTIAAKTTIAGGAAFIALCLSAGLRAALTAQAPADPSTIEALLFGWPIALPILFIAALAYDKADRK